MINNMKILTIALFLFFGFTQAGCSESQGDKKNDVAMLNKNESGAQVFDITGVTKKEGDVPHDFTFTYNGEKTSFYELTKNKVVFLNFWGTWCPPCRKEIPSIIEMNKDLGGDDFIVVGVALERRPDPKDYVKNFVNKQGINYVNFIASNEIKQAYRSDLRFVPTTMIIDKDRKIREKHTGAATTEQFKRMVQKYLN